MSSPFDAFVQRLERVEHYLERVINHLEGKTPPAQCGVSIGGAAHHPHPMYDEMAHFITAHNPRR
jgi:hypothetical protein